MTSRPTEAIIALEGVRKSYFVRSGMLGRRTELRAVDDVSLSVLPNESVGVVGESGSGKTTLTRLILQLIDPTKGKILFRNTDALQMGKEQVADLRRTIQAVFQDPTSSLDPRMRVAAILLEACKAKPRTPEADTLIAELLESVRLPRTVAGSFPHELSGGQRQRVAIARALAPSPSLLVLDEPVSSLDVSIRAQIMNLLKDLRQSTGIAYLLIAHDLATVRFLCDRVIVMYLGAIVEEAPVEDLFRSPRHPYTAALLASALPTSADEIEKRENEEAFVPQSEAPSLVERPEGCRFHTRCPFAQEVCTTDDPSLEEADEYGHRVACHFWEQIKARP